MYISLLCPPDIPKLSIVYYPAFPSKLSFPIVSFISYPTCPDGVDQFFST